MEALALAAKLGVTALPIILSDWGIMTAAIAFFAVMPLGHLTLGVALLLFGAFVPKIPSDEEKHKISVGSAKSKIAVSGNTRTVLMAAGLLIIAGAIGEALVT